MSPPPLPLSSFASPPPPRSALLLRQCESAGAVRLLLPQRAGLKRSAWELSLSLSPALSLSLPLSPSFVSSQGDEGAALWAVEEVRGSPGSSHSAAACCFAVVRLHPNLPHSPYVRVCQSCLPLPPLSSPLIDSSFRLPFACALYASLSFSLLLLVLSCSFRFAVSLFAPLLVFFTSQDKVGYSFYYTQKGFCVSLPTCLAGCFFLLFPTCLFPRSPSLPSPLPGWGVCGELKTLAGRAAENESTKQQNASA